MTAAPQSLADLDWTAEGHRPAGQPGHVNIGRTGEEWRPVVGWESYYEVSSEGRVRSLDRPGMTGRELKRSMSTVGGYEQVNLSVGGRKKVRKVHILVAAAFIGPRPDGLLIRHLDGVSTNNRVENLAYGTKRENFWDIALHNPDSRLARAICPSGHQITGANSYRAPQRKSGRTCRACRLAFTWASKEKSRRGARPSQDECRARADAKYLELMGGAS